MKNLLLSATALVSLVAGAMAADLAPPPAPAIPVLTWTGFYAGVNAGAGFATNGDNRVFDIGPDQFVDVTGVPFVHDAGTLTIDDDEDAGFVGGGQIGYNFQFGTFVVGLEADLQWADFGNGGLATFVPADAFPGFVPATRGNGVDWFGTVRARAGVAFDRVLAYATGGFAYGGIDNNGFFGGDDTATGWTVGGGIEWVLPVTLFDSSAVTLGVEGLWVNLDNNGGRRDFISIFTPTGAADFVGTVTPTGAAVFLPSARLEDDENEFAVIRAKLNVKF